ncbi:formate dehydrogenase region TAT target [Tepidimonas thermarum]|uniref:Formate dehydrogenase region TAT target n=1 Tax=Tepidimonas thermarum TaxID=335431 RepID=A0A554X3C1_9BURK|nr:formate dehydrogenase [Tepidimonas thermarum]TSE30339.1 formate dehydrogenase region TAT target [Tepidimonas thermarum]
MEPNSKPNTTLASTARRRWFGAVGAVGAAAAVASVVPVAQPGPVAQAQPQRPKPQRGGGYHASAHVEHYYRTARV